MKIFCFFYWLISRRKHLEVKAPCLYRSEEWEGGGVRERVRFQGKKQTNWQLTKNSGMFQFAIFFIRIRSYSTQFDTFIALWQFPVPIRQFPPYKNSNLIMYTLIWYFKDPRVLFSIAIWRFWRDRSYFFKQDSKQGDL